MSGPGVVGKKRGTGTLPKELSSPPRGFLYQNVIQLVELYSSNYYQQIIL